METPILTAEELFVKHNPQDGNLPQWAKKLMIEFAKLHVKEALKSASDEFERVKYDENDGDANQVSTSVILNAYPDSKIL